MEHVLFGDASFRAIEFPGSGLKCRHHLLHDLIEEHGGQLRVQDRAELERDLEEGEENEFVQLNDPKSSHSPNILLTFLKLSSAEQLNN